MLQELFHTGQHPLAEWEYIDVNLNIENLHYIGHDIHLEKVIVSKIKRIVNQYKRNGWCPVMLDFDSDQAVIRFGRASE
jgi:hypothetical protein